MIGCSFGRQRPNDVGRIREYVCAHTCAFIIGSRALIGAFWNEEENKRTLFLLGPSTLTCLTYPAIPDGCHVVTRHPKGNSISFSMFLLHFYLNCTGKVRQSDFEIEAILWFLILLLHFYPERILAEQLCISESHPNFPHFFFYPKEYGPHREPKTEITFLQMDPCWLRKQSSERVKMNYPISLGIKRPDNRWREKNKSSLFVISKELLTDSESGELKGRHYSNET